ncbi:MAG: hypothetical protein IJS45_04430 [Clostridia bacterium]|nr:hypothetical protein [Clostridia bacterium]
MELLLEFLDGNPVLKYLFSVKVSNKVPLRAAKVIKAFYLFVGLIAFIALIMGAILFRAYESGSRIHTVGVVLGAVGGGYIVITLLIRGLAAMSKSIINNKKEQRRL